jgi:hypothetical protein
MLLNDVEECVALVARELRTKAFVACALIDRPVVDLVTVRFNHRSRQIEPDLPLRLCRGLSIADAAIPVCEAGHALEASIGLGKCERDLVAAVKKRLVTEALHQVGASRSFNSRREGSKHKEGQRPPWWPGGLLPATALLTLSTEEMPSLSPPPPRQSKVKHQFVDDLDKRLGSTTANNGSSALVQSPRALTGTASPQVYYDGLYEVFQSFGKRISTILMLGVGIGFLLFSRGKMKHDYFDDDPAPERGRQLKRSAALDEGSSRGASLGVSRAPIFLTSLEKERSTQPHRYHHDAGVPDWVEPQSGAVESPSAWLSGMLRCRQKESPGTSSSSPTTSSFLTHRGTGGLSPFPRLEMKRYNTSDDAASEMLHCAELEARQLLEERVMRAEAARGAAEAAAALLRAQRVEELAAATVSMSFSELLENNKTELSAFILIFVCILL